LNQTYAAAAKEKIKGQSESRFLLSQGNRGLITTYGSLSDLCPFLQPQPLYTSF